MPTVLIPGALRRFTAGQAELRVEATTVRAALAAVDRQFPGVAARVLDGDAPRPFIRLFVDGDDIDARAGLDTPLADRGELAIVPAIAGGRGA